MRDMKGFKARFWDTFNHTMTYSNKTSSLSVFFFDYEEGVNNGNGIELMLSFDLMDKNGEVSRSD